MGADQEKKIEALCKEDFGKSWYFDNCIFHCFGFWVMPVDHIDLHYIETKKIKLNSQNLHE